MNTIWRGVELSYQQGDRWLSNFGKGQYQCFPSRKIEHDIWDYGVFSFQKRPSFAIHHEYYGPGSHRDNLCLTEVIV